MTDSPDLPVLLRTTFRDALSKVELVIKALKERGIECRPNSSLGSLFAKLRQLNEQYERDPSGDVQQTFLVSIEAFRIAEALEITLDVPAAREAIRHIVHSDMSLSGRQRSRGKDALWELELYRRLKLGGAKAHFDEPDLVVELGMGLGNYGVACKKVYSEKSVAAAFNKGCEQLTKKKIPGVVAFNLDDMVEERVVQALTKDALHKHLGGKCQQFVSCHEAAFKKNIDREQCDGVLISISAVSETPDGPLPVTLARVQKLHPKAHPDALAKARLAAFRQWLDNVVNLNRKA